jgi:type IV secretion system protein TrbE
MLKIRFREEDGTDVHPLQALCPWLNHVTPGLVLNKDGSLLAAFQYRGVDPDDLFDAQVDSYTEQMQKVFSRLDSRVTAWWIVDKRRDTNYIEGTFENQTAADLDDIYSQRFKRGQHFKTSYTLYLLYSGNTGTDKFFDRVARIQSEKGVTVTAALMTALKESLSGRKAFARDVGTLRDNILSFERLIAGFANAVPLKLNRLEGDDFTSALGAVLNRASNPTQMRKPPDALLDAYLPRNYVSAGLDLIKFEGSQRSTFVGVIGIKGWPSGTSPMLFETLAAMDMEMTICQIVRFLDPGESSATINPAIEYYHLTQYGLITHAIAKASGSEPEAKPGKESMLHACKEALERIGAEGVTYAYMAVSVFVYGETKGDLKRSCDRVVTNLENSGFTADRERINAMPAFAALLPGQWATQSRYDLVSIENVADACPIYTMDEGSTDHAFFSKLVFRKPVPKMAVFGNRYGGRFNFSSHVDQVGHMLIIAPTGGGKSTFVNFCLSQFQRYGEGVRTIIFDRNRSCEIVTQLHDGTHIDLRKAGTRVNPLAVMRDGTEDGRTWVREFILRRFADGGYIADTDDRQNLDTALEQLSLSNGPVSMSKLAVLVSKRLEAQLSEWLQGRPYGMFDNEDDDLSLDHWTTIEMASIMGIERIARAFLDLVFRKIYTQLDGKPTFIYIEEASFLLNNPMFAPMIAEWLKAVRARNGFLWLTVQSPEAVSNAEMSATILDNIFTFLLLHNNKVESHREHYRDNFGFEHHQIDMIASLQPKRDYLLVQDGRARVLTTDFTPAALAYLRSEKPVLNVFDKYAAAKETGWKNAYLNEVQSM